jgi:cytochrome d ubiquinol oxidase subunit II
MLALAWLAIIGFCIIMYVVLDGFTLGTGMLLPFMDAHERNIATSVILPTWDGNQTWLVLGMASLYGAFPLAFSELLPLLYLPLLIMVVALLFRGVAFEFRMKSETGKHRWEMVFAGAGLVVTLIQGYILGNFVQGFDHTKSLGFLPTIIDPFDIATALSLVIGYALLGATRLILKTEGQIQNKMYSISKILAVALIMLIVVISIWTPFVYPLVKQRWFNLQYMPFLAILPLITFCCFAALIAALRSRNEVRPYYLSVVLFLCPLFLD